MADHILAWNQIWQDRQIRTSFEDTKFKEITLDEYQEKKIISIKEENREVLFLISIRVGPEMESKYYVQHEEGNIAASDLLPPIDPDACEIQYQYCDESDSDTLSATGGNKELSDVNEQLIISNRIIFNSMRNISQIKGSIIGHLSEESCI